MSRDEIIERFRLSAAPYFSDDRIKELIDMVLNLEAVPSVNELMVLLEA